MSAQRSALFFCPVNYTAKVKEELQQRRFSRFPVAPQVLIVLWGWFMADASLWASVCLGCPLSPSKHSEIICGLIRIHDDTDFRVLLKVDLFPLDQLA